MHAMAAKHRAIVLTAAALREVNFDVFISLFVPPGGLCLPLKPMRSCPRENRAKHFASARLRVATTQTAPERFFCFSYCRPPLMPRTESAVERLNLAQIPLSCHRVHSGLTVGSLRRTAGKIPLSRQAHTRQLHEIDSEEGSTVNNHERTSRLLLLPQR